MISKVPYSNNINLRSVANEYLIIPKSKTIYYDKAVGGPKEWNMLPEEIRKCDSLSKFKNSLKLHLLSDIA